MLVATSSVLLLLFFSGSSAIYDDEDVTFDTPSSDYSSYDEATESPPGEDSRIFFPHGHSEGDVFIPANDDGHSGTISISAAVFPFFGRNYTSLYVNTNGVISFVVSVSGYTPDPFPLPGNTILITPLWADVDTRRGGTNSYRQLSRRDRSDFPSDDLYLAANAQFIQADGIIRNQFSDHVTFESKWMFIATWDSVGFFGSEMPTIVNSFQAVLLTDYRHSFIIFNYGNIDWTTGTSSGGDANGLGGIPAQAGFNAGDGVRFFSIPGSRTSAVVDIETTTNVGTSGRWVFQTDAATIRDDLSATTTAASFTTDIGRTDPPIIEPRTTTPVAEITVPQDDYEPERTSWIDCEGSFMTVFVNRSLIQDGVPRDLRLADARCRGIEYDEHYVEMQAMYDLCGTTVEQGDNGTMIFRNEIRYVPTDSANVGNVISRDFALRIPIVCRMNTGGVALMTSFHPNMRTVEYREEEFGSFGFQLMVYRGDGFNDPYDAETDYPVPVNVKDTVYFEASVNTQDNLRLFVDTCRATPSPNPSDTPNYVILENGCARDDTFRFLSSGDPTVQRFSLEAFTFIGRFSTVFVHCEMLVCKLNDTDSRCAQGCQARSPVRIPVRMKRDAIGDKSSRMYSLAQGPLVIQQGPPQLRHRKSVPDISGSTGDDQEFFGNNQVLTLLGSGLLITLCVIAVYKGIASRAKKGNKRRQSNVENVFGKNTE